MTHHIQDKMTENKLSLYSISLISLELCFTPLQKNIHWNVCFFIIFFSPSVNLFFQQFCCIFIRVL